MAQLSSHRNINAKGEREQTVRHYKDVHECADYKEAL